MEASNDQLKHLIDKTDEYFTALLKQPESELLNDQYERAKRELNTYIMNMRKHLDTRC